MSFRASVILFLALSGLFPADESRQWSHSAQNKWPASCLKRGMQSPIALHAEESICTYLPDLFLNEGYHEDLIASISNIGYSVQVNTSGNIVTPGFYDVFQEAEYSLHATHFHWPAEHTVDGHRYPLEAHFVHYQTRLKNLENALKFPYGVAVIAVFYQFDERRNPVFDDIIGKVPAVATPDATPVLLKNPINFQYLLPRDVETYYRYEGSLTTPECNEGITWILLATPSFISHKQMHKMTNIYNSQKHPLKHISRHLQKSNGRIVLTNLCY